MHAAASGHGNSDIPEHVAKEFAESDPGGKLPARARDETKHDPKTGQFASNPGGSTKYTHQSVNPASRGFKESRTLAHAHAEHLRNIGHEGVKVTIRRQSPTVPGKGISVSEERTVHHGAPKGDAATPPARARDMSATKWSVLKRLFLEWINEEESEEEHAADAETAHDPHSGQFTSGAHMAKAEEHHNAGVTLHRQGMPYKGHEEAKHAHQTAAHKIQSKDLDAKEHSARAWALSEKHKTGKVGWQHRQGGLLREGPRVGRDDQLQTEPNSALPAALTTKRPKGRAASVLFAAPSGNVLFVKRAADEENYPGHWALPGGKADGEEDFGDCARREANEELGGDCSFDGMEELERKRTRFGWDHVTFRVPAAAEFAPTLNGEHSEFAWAPPDAPPSPLHPAVAATLEGLDQGDGAEDAEQEREPDGKFASVGHHNLMASKHKATAESRPIMGTAKEAPHREAQSAHEAARTAHQGFRLSRGKLSHEANEKSRALGVLAAKDAALDTTIGPYPVRAQDAAGRWVYDADLLAEAARRARLAGRSDLARRAEAIRKREFAAAEDETHLNGHLVPHYWDWAMGGKSGTGSNQLRMSREVKTDRRIRSTGAADAGGPPHDPKNGQFTSGQHSETAAYHKERQAHHEGEGKSRGESLSKPGKGSHAAAASKHGSAAFYHGKASENPANTEYVKQAHYNSKLANSASKAIEKAGESYSAAKENNYESPTMTSQEHSARRIARYLKENRIRMRGRGRDSSQAADTVLLAMDKRVYDSDGHLHVDTSHISKAAINEYLGEEIPNWRKLGLDPKRRYKLLRGPAELEKAVDTFRNLPILSEHVPIDADTHDPDLVIGSTGSDPRWNPPYLDNSTVYWPRSAIDDIENRKRCQLSSAYRYVPVMEPGTYNGKHFDGKMTQIVGSHLALVEEGRAGADVAVGDSLRDPWELIERAILRVGGVV